MPNEGKYVKMHNEALLKALKLGFKVKNVERGYILHQVLRKIW